MGEERWRNNVRGWASDTGSQHQRMHRQMDSQRPNGGTGKAGGEERPKEGSEQVPDGVQSHSPQNDGSEQIQTKLLKMLPKAHWKVAEEARQHMRNQKVYAHDQREGVKKKEVEIRDQVKLPQRKITIKSPWDTDPLTIMKIKGLQSKVW